MGPQKSPNRHGAVAGYLNPSRRKSGSDFVCGQNAPGGEERETTKNKQTKITGTTEQKAQTLSLCVMIKVTLLSLTLRRVQLYISSFPQNQIRLLYSRIINQSRQTCPMKGQIVNIFGFVKQFFVSTMQLCSQPTKAATDNMKKKGAAV